jgi:hypothetical protein
MRRPSPSPSRIAAAKAFRRWCVPSVMQELARYATAKLRLAPIDAEVVGRVEAVELVNMMFDEGLAGRLPFDLPGDATEEQTVRYLSRRLGWMCADLFRQEARTASDEALDELPDETPDAFERLSGLRMRAGVIAAVAHDPEASAYLEELREGKTREQIARGLGMTIGHAKAVRKRIARYAEAAMNDNGEDEPQSSGPRGDDHVPTTEERRGAPPEPHRGAGGARRRG